MIVADARGKRRELTLAVAVSIDVSTGAIIRKRQLPMIDVLNLGVALFQPDLHRLACGKAKALPEAEASPG